MPTYDYKCDNCGYEFEIFQSMKDEKLSECPSCGKNTLKRLIGGGGGLIFKGTGFYLTDYKGKKADTSSGKTGSEKQTPADKKEPSSSSAGTETSSGSKSSSETKSVPPSGEKAAADGRGKKTAAKK